MVKDRASRAVIEALLAAEPDRPCRLIVGADVRVLEAECGRLASEARLARVGVGRELSAVLLQVPPGQRSRTVQPWLSERLMALAPGPVVCTEIDLLFEPSLLLDPLTLLRRASRVARLLVAWPGSHESDVLTYATPDHAHYRTWRRPEVAVIPIGSIGEDGGG